MVSAYRVAWLGGSMAVCLAVATTLAQDPVTAEATSQPTSPDPSPQSEHATTQPSRDFYLGPRASGMKHESTPPGYARSLDKTEIGAFKDLSWLDFGLEQRTRFDRRDDNYLTGVQTDDQFLMRSRMYLGFKNILDPFRAAVEFQDSRQFYSDFPEVNRDVDEADFLQAYGELYFKEALGEERPLRFQFGRMTMDYADRRLVGRNGFRNTTNAYDGFRVQLGQKKNDWQVDFFAVQPVDRRLTRPDRADEERWLYGLVGMWRRWSDVMTLEPFYFILDEDRKDPDSPDRELHTFGLHGYGPIGETGFDYDFNSTFQVGEDGVRDHRAFAAHGQLGYSFEHSWKPRLAVWCNYASGDQTPGDDLTQRFDPLFGDSHTHYGYADLFNWTNMINPALQFSFKPTDKLTVDTFYRAYWAAEDQDSWAPVGRRDPEGRSGDFIGQEFDISARYQFDRRLELELGYAYFIPGAFAENTGDADDSDYFYVQTVLRF